MLLISLYFLCHISIFLRHFPSGVLSSLPALAEFSKFIVSLRFQLKIQIPILDILRRCLHLADRPHNRTVNPYNKAAEVSISITTIPIRISQKNCPTSGITLDTSDTMNALPLLPSSYLKSTCFTKLLHLRQDKFRSPMLYLYLHIPAIVRSPLYTIIIAAVYTIVPSFLTSRYAFLFSSFLLTDPVLSHLPSQMPVLTYPSVHDTASP